MKVQLRIINKNIVNGIETPYTLDENFIFTDNYNETLDSVNLRISHLSSEIDIEAGDYVWLLSDDYKINNYYMVQNYVCTQDTVGYDNTSYSYDISLCSQTKDLEGCICPNLSITPKRTGTKRSIYWYLNLYLNLYGKKRRVQTLGVMQWVNQWTLSNDVQAKFSTIDAPELQWNAPTLREVFNDLMMIADCIPIMRDNVISFIDLTEKKNLITDFNYMQRSQSIDDYASELKMNLQNVLQTGIDNVRNTITTTEYLTFSSSDYLITSENIRLQTTYPILKVKHLWMGMFMPSDPAGTTGSYGANFISKDLTNLEGENYVKEYQEYITLPIVYRLNDATGDKSNYQNFCIYYNRNGNEITGFTNLSKDILWIQKNTLDSLKDRMVEIAIANGETTADATYGRASGTKNNYFSTFFKIEYETMTDQVFSASKDGAKNKRTVVDNQTNSWVDAWTQGNLEYQKANRLGNQTIMFNQRVTDIDNAIKIGDYYTETKNGKTYDIVIYQVQYQTHEDHIEVNAYGTKDYILKNYWTGINSKIRTWVNARDEAMVRHELEKYYCGLSFTRHNEIESVANGYDLGKVIGESLVQDDNKAIKFAMINTELESGEYQPANTLIATIWTFNNTFDFTGISANKTYNILFYSNETLYGQILVVVDESGTPVKKIYYRVNNTNTLIYSNGTWSANAYKEIVIIGGADANNQDFIDWLEDNATTERPTNAYEIELLSRIIGNSYVFTAGYNDNYEATRKVKTGGETGLDASDIEYLEYQPNSPYHEPHIETGTIQTTDNLGGIPTEPLKYTDENGEFVKLNMVAFCDLPIESGTNGINIPAQRSFFMTMFNRPILYNQQAENKKFLITKDYHKDNKEIFKLSVQFELFAEDDIVFTKYFLQNNPIIQDDPQAPDIKIYGSFDKENILPSGAFEIIATLTRTSISDVVSEFNIETVAQVPYIYITDANNNVLIRLDVTNHRTQTGVKFYLNILKDKDYSYYNILGQKEGEI